MLKDTLTVLRGTVAAQALGILALPLLTRLFTPEAFGQLQLYLSVVGILLVVTAMRYEIALLRAEGDAEFTATLQLCGLINFSVALLVAAGCALVAAQPGLVGPSVRELLWFLPAGVLLGGLVQTIGYLPLRHKAYAAGASAKVMQAVGNVVGAVGIGVTAPFTGGLVTSDLLGRVASICSLARHRSLFTRETWQRPQLQALRAAALRFREFPLVAVPGGLINAAGGTMTALLMYGAFDAAVSGQYGLVERSLMLPVGMVAVAVSQVFIADLSASLRDGGGNALRLYRGVVRRMFMLGLLPAALVGLFAPAVFAIAFGPTWALAGEMARIMAPLVLVALVTSSVNMAVMILGWQKVQLGWELARLVAVSAAWLSIVRLDLPPTVAIGAHVAVSVLMNLAYLWLADHMLRRHASQCPMAHCGRANVNQ
jgi:O-antigen/teichoic acid export membrane protein